MEDALNSIAAEMNIGRSDLIQIVLREWLETNAYLPVREIDEESETDGSAQAFRNQGITRMAEISTIQRRWTQSAWPAPNRQIYPPPSSARLPPAR